MKSVYFNHFLIFICDYIFGAEDICFSGFDAPLFL
jgi:hypothetical protein